ncbi:MAG: T9SS type A sorting domain-containing protein [Candidatus Cloacimonetes bacterium]|nr:T9SS type A sorting domain-containing protein [Candidatus Cloacimonadota bacterium]
MKRYTLFVLFALTFWTLTAIEVSGTQSGTWSPDNNPYQIVGDITVPAGSVLTIQPGVIVQAMGNYRINAEGSIQAVGTQADSIYFMNAQIPPTSIWKGLRLENATVPSSFKYCYIEYADYGVNAVKSPVEVSYCYFSNNKNGMQLYGIGDINPPAMDVHHNLVEYSINHGILIPQNSNAWVHHNEVRFNGTGSQYRGAIQLSNQSANGQNNPIIEHNHIHHNFKQGITAWDTVGASAINPTIRFNHIESNLTGIYLLNASGIVHDNLILNNFIVGDMNSGAGMMIAGATSLPHIAANTITGNYTGFYITTNAMPVLGDLSENHAWAFGQNIIQDNIDATNTLNSVVCDSYPLSSNIIKAQNNDWGVYTAAEIAIGIRDHNDDPALPTVVFEPWLEEQTSLTISGSYSWNMDDYGVLAPGELKVILVAEESREILETHVLESNPFSFESNVEEAFLALICGVDETREIWAAAGGLGDDCLTFSPIEATNIPLGVIHIAAWQQYHVKKKGEIQIIEGREMWPVYNSFLIFPYDSVDYFYDEGDYRYIYKQEFLEDGVWETFYLGLDLVYEKTQNFIHEEYWIQNLPEDGILMQRWVSCYIDADGLATTIANDTEQLRTKRFIGPDYQHIYIHDSAGYADRYLDVVEAEAGTTILYHRPNTFNPSELRMRNADGNIPGTRNLSFWWQAPAFSGTNYDSYRFYRQDQGEDPVLVGTVPFSEYRFFLSDQSGNGPVEFWMVASDGTVESGPSNIITVEFPVSNEDLVIAPVLNIYPNPVKFSPGNTLKIETKGLMNPCLKVYNIRGQQVYSQKQSTQDFEWQGLDLKGKAVGSGIYMLRLESSNLSPISRKIMVIK